MILHLLAQDRTMLIEAILGNILNCIVVYTLFGKRKYDWFFPAACAVRYIFYNILDEKDSTELIKEVMKMIRVQRKSKEVSVYNATQILKQNDYLKKNLQKKQKEYEKYAEKEKQKIVKLQEKADKVWERWAE